MRSAATFVVLALTGAVDLVAAGLCKPSSISSSSGIIATPTDPSASSSTTPAPRVVTNEVVNGNFAVTDPDTPSGISDFNSDGNCQQVQGPGYQGGGSSDKGCVRMNSRTQTVTPDKRQEVDYNAMVEQQLSDLSSGNTYTVRFYYAILRNDVANTCRVNAYYGNELFGSTPYFPVVAEITDGNVAWLEFVHQAVARTSSGFIRFALTCTGSGSAEIYIDQIFVSDKVDPENISGVQLSYISSHIASSTAVPSSTTSSATSATVTSSTTSRTTTTTSSSSTTTTTAPSSTCGLTNGEGCSLNPSVDPTVSCQTTGFLAQPSQAFSKEVYPYQSTPEQCAAVCAQVARCVASAYDRLSKYCVFITNSLDSAGFEESSNGVGWSDQACWDCPTC